MCLPRGPSAALSVGLRGKDTNKVNVLGPSSIYWDGENHQGGGWVVALVGFCPCHGSFQMPIKYLSAYWVGCWIEPCAAQRCKSERHVTGSDHIDRDNRKTSESWDQEQLPARILKGEVSNTGKPRTNRASFRGRRGPEIRELHTWFNWMLSHVLVPLVAFPPYFWIRDSTVSFCTASHKFHSLSYHSVWCPRT